VKNHSDLLIVYLCHRIGVMPDIRSCTLYGGGLSVIVMSVPTLQRNEGGGRSRCRLHHRIICVTIRLMIVPRHVGSVRHQLGCRRCDFTHVRVLKALNEAVGSSPRSSLGFNLILKASVENCGRLSMAHDKLVRLGDEVLKIIDQLIAVLSPKGTISKRVTVGYKIAQECRLLCTVGEGRGWSGQRGEGCPCIALLRNAIWIA